MTLIAYGQPTNTGAIKVKLDGEYAGSIVRNGMLWHYQPKGRGNPPGESYSTVEAVKRSIDAPESRMAVSPPREANAMTKTEIAIGDTLFRVPDNWRKGQEWKGSRIVAETRGTWVLENGSRPNKKTMRTPRDRQGYSTRYYTLRGMEDRIFCDKHARDIASAVSVCNDPVTLTLIAKMVGKVLKP